MLFTRIFPYFYIKSKQKGSVQGIPKQNLLEVPARFELANEGFADLCLTTWPRYHMK